MKRSNPNLVTLSCVLATLLMAGCNDNPSPAPAVTPASQRPLTTAEFLDLLNSQAAHDPEARRLLALINPVPPNPLVSDLAMNQRRQFLIGLIATQSTDPDGLAVNSDEDWRKGAHEAPPAWTGAPFAVVNGVRVKIRTELEFLRGSDGQFLATEVIEGTTTIAGENGAEDTTEPFTHRYIPFEMAATPSTPLAPGQDMDGLNPPNMAVNRRLGARNPHREAMPAGLANRERTLHVDATHLTAAATEWISMLFRMVDNVDHNFDPAEAATYVLNFYGADAPGPLTYTHVMYNSDDGRMDEENTAWDPLGRPLNPNPHVDDIGITGQGSYFRLGPNKSVEVLITVKINNRTYGVFMQGDEPGTPLSLLGRMHTVDDLNDDEKLNAIFATLRDETGITLNREELEEQDKIAVVWNGPVAGDTHQTRNAWTVTRLYHVHFDNVAEMATYGAVHADFNGHEVTTRSLVDLAYVIPIYLAPNHPSHMLASHGSMLSFALGKFLSTDPEEIESLMQPMQGPTLNDNRINFGALRRLLQEAAGSDSNSHHSGDDAASEEEG